MRGPIEPNAILVGQRILAVEDEFMVLLEIDTVLSNAGAAVVRCATIAHALQAIDTETCNAAILDVRVGRESIAAVARKLSERGIPFLFYTGQVPSESTITQWPNVQIVSKPALPAVLINAVVELLRSAAAPRARG